MAAAGAVIEPRLRPGRSLLFARWRARHQATCEPLKMTVPVVILHGRIVERPITQEQTSVGYDCQCYLFLLRLPRAMNFYVFHDAEVCGRKLVPEVFSLPISARLQRARAISKQTWQSLESSWMVGVCWSYHLRWHLRHGLYLRM